MTVAHDLGLWFWRLVPANPILVRVVNMGGKRIRHLWARLIYLALLFVVMVFAQNFFAGPKSLAELAKNATQVFMYVSLVQLFLMSFIAPVFCAGAITQEKDANTYHILLTTPLSNGQIVLGSLLSRMYFIWVLLLAGLPIFGITMIYGGVTTTEVFYSLGLAATTGLITGSLAIAISFLKVGTRRTILAFFVGIATYLLGVWALGLSTWGQLNEASVGTSYFGTSRQIRMSWLAPIHPFLALSVVTGQTPAPPPEELLHYGWPGRWLLAHPAAGYMAVMSLGSAALILLSVIFVRRGNREGESAVAARLRSWITRTPDGELRRKPRRVWHNPIAWREAATQASAGGRSWLRWIFATVGFAGGILLLIGFESGWWGLAASNPARFELARDWLIKLIWIQLAVVLLIVTNTAASSLTREKESTTMELLLSTPLTSAYITRGIVLGLVQFIWPLIAAPTLTLLMFVVADLIRRGPSTIVAPEAVLIAPMLMIAFASAAAMIGLQFSLMSKKTVQAVMVSTGIVLGATALMWGCGQAIVSASAAIASVFLPFSPLPAVAVLIDVGVIYAAQPTPPQADEILGYRITRLVASLASCATYAGITYAMYRSLVRSFDMTVRRQSA